MVQGQREASGTLAAKLLLGGIPLLVLGAVLQLIGDDYFMPPDQAELFDRVGLVLICLMLVLWVVALWLLLKRSR